MLCSLIILSEVVVAGKMLMGFIFASGFDMMKGVFSGILVLHGLIHLLGFIKAYNIANISQLNHQISKPVGMIWLFVAVLFLLVAVLFFIKNDYWMGFGITAVVISQILIIMTWQDAKLELFQIL